MARHIQEPSSLFIISLHRVFAKVSDIIPDDSDLSRINIASRPFTALKTFEQVRPYIDKQPKEEGLYWHGTKTHKNRTIILGHRIKMLPLALKPIWQFVNSSQLSDYQHISTQTHYNIAELIDQYIDYYA